MYFNVRPVDLFQIYSTLIRAAANPFESSEIKYLEIVDLSLLKELLVQEDVSEIDCKFCGVESLEGEGIYSTGTEIPEVIFTKHTPPPHKKNMSF